MKANAAVNNLMRTYATIKRTGSLPGLRSGIEKIDAHLGNWISPKRLIVLGARPRIGKTAMAMQIAKEIHQERTVVLFSLEMSTKEVVEQFISREADVSFQQLEDFGLTGFGSDELAAIRASMEWLSTANIYIVDDCSTLAMMNARLEEITREVGNEGLPPVGLIVVDFVQIVETDMPSAARYLSIRELTRGLRKMAKGNNAAVMALSQLKRRDTSIQSIGRRKPTDDDLRPVLEDLAEGDSLGQDADLVILLHRKTEEGKEVQDAVEAIVRKNKRNKKEPIIDLNSDDKMRFM